MTADHRWTRQVCTKQQFNHASGLPIGTNRHWEQHVKRRLVNIYNVCCVSIVYQESYQCDRRQHILVNSFRVFERFIWILVLFNSAINGNDHDHIYWIITEYFHSLLSSSSMTSDNLAWPILFWFVCLFFRIQHSSRFVDSSIHD
jgi:hypothetical protein